MKVIYEPKGRAKEYAELALNIYNGCSHGCKYCYAPACMRKTLADFQSDPKARSRILTDFAADCDELASKGDERRILFSFLSDPYQPLEKETGFTRILLCSAMGFWRKVDILTKGTYDLVSRDFELMERSHGKIRLGVSLCFINDESRKEWEPNAAPVEDRIRIIKEAHEKGIQTWVSVEPVIYPDEAIEVIKTLKPYVNVWKIGKINHNKKIEKAINWADFLKKALRAVYGSEYYIKKDLLAAAVMDGDGSIQPRPVFLPGAGGALC